MNINSRILLALCPLAATLALGCDTAPSGGGDNDTDDDTVGLDDNHKPRLKRVQLTRLALASAEAPSMLHPVTVEVEMDIEGEAFDSDVLVGLRSADGEQGCVLGALEAKTTQAGASSLVMSSEFFIKGDCAAMIDRPDLELFASFDPWRSTEYDRQGTAPETGETLYDVTQASTLNTEDCQDCDIETKLSASPGLDAQLREVGIGNSVAVLQVPGARGDDQAPVGDTPDFSISTQVRVTGLAQGAAPDQGETFVSYAIRPRAGVPGTEELRSSELGWESLLERRQDEDGAARYLDKTTVEARGQSALSKAAAVYIGDALADRMIHGDWGEVDEFELQTCVGSTYAQAVFEGETAPRDNDCAVLNVVVAKEQAGARRTSPMSGVVEAGAPGIGEFANDNAVFSGSNKAREALTWGTSWETNNSFAGSNYKNGINFDTWIDLNASDGPSSTYGGRPVASAATWFEVGASSIATVFNNDVTLLDTYLTAIGYNTGAGTIAGQVEVLGQSIFALPDTATTNGELTLEQILQAANVSTTTTWDIMHPLVGYSFEDGCGTVTAGVFIKGEIGLDNQASKIEVSGGSGGMTVAGTIAPTAAILAESKAEAAYDGFLSINVGISMAIDILRVTMPFVSSATVSVGSPSTLTLGQSAALTLSTLAGKIDFSFDYKYPCIKWAGPFPYPATCYGDHSHNLATWNGIDHTFSLFNVSSSFIFGDGADDFCAEYDGSYILARTVHGTTMSGTGGYNVGQTSGSGVLDYLQPICDSNGSVSLHSTHGYALQAGSISNGWLVSGVVGVNTWETFIPERQSDGTWAFRTFHNRYLQAMNDGTIRQQDHVGSWERFTIETP